MTPHADSIKAFYDPDTASSAAILQPAVVAGINSAAAFSVLAFQQQQQPDVYPVRQPHGLHLSRIVFAGPAPSAQASWFLDNIDLGCHMLPLTDTCIVRVTQGMT